MRAHQVDLRAELQDLPEGALEALLEAVGRDWRDAELSAQDTLRRRGAGVAVRGV